MDSNNGIDGVDIVDVGQNLKYPKSINNVQCIGPCYEAGSTIIHPVTLDEITNPNNHFCPVDRIILTNSETGERMVDTIDFCYVPTVKQQSSQLTDELKHKLIAPTFVFDTNYFLKIYYDIGSLEDGIAWLDKNSSIPYKTKERIFNQTMVAYGDNLSIADHRLVIFIREIMVHNIQKIYAKVSKYIDTKDGKIVLIPNSANVIVDNPKEKLITSYIKSKFLGDSEISRFVSKFLRYGSEHLKTRNLSELLVKSMIDYIEKRIESSF